MFPARIPIVSSPPSAGFQNLYSLDFDGSDDFVLISDATVSRFVEGDAFTVSLWMRNTNTSDTTTRTMFSIADDGSAGYRFSIKHTTSLDLIYFKSEGGTGDEVNWYVGSIDLNDGDWHHFVLVNTSSTSREMFVDGDSIGTHTASYVQPTSVFDTITIGANRQATSMSDPNIGNIDEVGIWDVVLDDDAVTAIYNSGTPIALDADSGDYDNSGDLQGWWRFEEGSGTSAADSSTNSNAGTLTNGVAYSADVPS